MSLNTLRNPYFYQGYFSRRSSRSKSKKGLSFSCSTLQCYNPRSGVLWSMYSMPCGQQPRTIKVPLGLSLVFALSRKSGILSQCKACPIVIRSNFYCFIMALFQSLQSSQILSCLFSLIISQQIKTDGLCEVGSQFEQQLSCSSCDIEIALTESRMPSKQPAQEAIIVGRPETRVIMSLILKSEFIKFHIENGGRIYYLGLPLMSLSSLFSVLQRIEVQPKASVLVSVTDVSAVYKKCSGKRFILKLKVIDSSFNQDSNASLKEGTCTVFLFAKTINQFPIIARVGDILLLHNFKFKKWQEKFQALAMGNDYSWAIFQGTKTSDHYPITFRQNFKWEDTQEIKKRLSLLKEFNNSYFSTRSLSLACRKAGQKSDFDMILKVLKCEPLQTNYKVLFTDGKDRFSMISKHNLLPSIYKVRSIAQIQQSLNGFQLLTNDYTYQLLIPEYMRSFQEFGKIQIQRPEALPTPWVQGSEYTSVVDDSYKKFPMRTLSQLHNFGSKYSPSRVKVWITDILADSFKDALRGIYKNKLKSFQTAQKDFMYHLGMIVQDQSMGNKGLGIFLFSFDGNGDNFIPKVSPKSIFGHNVLRQEMEFERMKNYLLQETCKQKPIELCLQALTSEGKVVWRVVGSRLTVA